MVWMARFLTNALPCSMPSSSEEAVAHGVAGDVVLDTQVVGAVHRHAAAVAVVDRRVPDVLPVAVAAEVPVDRIARQRQVLAHPGELDAGDLHARARHGHDVPAEVGVLRILGRLDADVARQHGRPRRARRPRR